MRHNSGARIMGSTALVFIWALAIVTLVHGAAPASTQLRSKRPPTDQERRGKQIYLQGTSASGRPIMAVFGDAATEVPASALVCVNCHGYDGHGKPEGGISPSNITQESLTKPYGVTLPSGRKHPAYNDRFLLRAITMGMDPAGNALSTAMPRFRFTRSEVDDLIAYLKVLGTVRDPGLTDNSIRVGVLLPKPGAQVEMGKAVKAVLTAYFEDLNEQGGIFNRRIELRFADSGQTPAATVDGARDLIEKEAVFALTGAFVAGAEKEIDALIREEEIPLIGAVTDLPETGFPLNRYVFYLLAGQRQLGRAMVEFAAQRFQPQGRRPAILYPENETARSVMEAIEDQCQKSGWQPVTRLGYAPGRFEAQRLVGQLKEHQADVLFFLGSDNEQGSLSTEARREDWQAVVLIPGSLAGREVFDHPSGSTTQVFLAFPRGSADQKQPAIKEFRTFAERHKLPGRHLTAQVEAYCSAMILVEGLKRAGRDVSREKLTTVLEGLYEFETGLIPMITFGPNRRVGAQGATIVSVDSETKRLVSVSEWVEPR